MDIPGTHESCAIRGPSGTEWQCQTMSLAEQLAAGIRFVDIRCAISGTQFEIHHGPLDEQLEFGADVMGVCLQFLQANPSECIIMSVKKETSNGSEQQFEEIFDSYVQASPGQWYLGDTIPTLGDVRGKIVLFRRFEAQAPVLGIAAPPSLWADDATFSIVNNARLTIQDQYDVNTVCNIPDKWNAIESLLGEAQTAPDDYWYINFTSGTSPIWGAYPYTVAKGSPGIEGENDHLNDYFSGPIDGKVGTILMDFPEYPDNQVLIGQLISLSLANQAAWPGAVQVPNTTMSDSPSAVLLNGSLYCFYQGGSDNGMLFYARTADGVNWESSFQVPNTSMSDGPSAVVFNDSLYCFLQGSHESGELLYNRQ